MTSIVYLGPLLEAESYRRVRALCESPYHLPDYFDIFFPGGARPHWLLLYRDSGHAVPIAFAVAERRIAILTQVLRLAAHEFDYMIADLFERFPSVRRLDVELAAVSPRDLALPSIIYRESADFVAALPDRAAAYQEQLGRSTRQTLRRRMRALAREFADCNFEVFRCGAIQRDHVASIIQLNHARMRSKKRVSGIDETYMQRLYQLAKMCGIVTTLSVGGRVIAGTICSELPGHTYMHVIAHDDAYARFSPGTACLLHAIEESIRAGTSEFHFLWGTADYKRRLLGVDRPLYSFGVFPGNRARFIGAIVSSPRLARHHAGRLARLLRRTAGTIMRALHAAVGPHGVRS